MASTALEFTRPDGREPALNASTFLAPWIAWEFIEVIKEANPVEVVGNATVEGTYEGSKMQVTFHHQLKQSTADMTLWLQK